MLYSNKLAGFIPTELGNLDAIEILSVENNQLTGIIPPELGDLAALEMLFLDYNQLTGSIPPELGGLTNLEILSLTTNQLSVSIWQVLVRIRPCAFISSATCWLVATPQTLGCSV